MEIIENQWIDKNNIQDNNRRKQLRKKTIQIAENPIQAQENKK